MNCSKITFETSLERLSCCVTHLSFSDCLNQMMFFLCRWCIKTTSRDSSGPKEDDRSVTAYISFVSLGLFIAFKSNGYRLNMEKNSWIWIIRHWPHTHICMKSSRINLSKIDQDYMKLEASLWIYSYVTLILYWR